MLGPVAYFEPSGDLLRSWRVDVGALFAVAQERNQRSPERVHLPLSDRSFIVRTNLDPGGFVPPSLYRVPIEFYSIDSLYAAHSLGRWEGREHIYVPGIPASMPFPFEVHMAAGDSPLSVYVTNSDRYEVHQFSATGALQRNRSAHGGPDSHHT